MPAQVSTAAQAPPQVQYPKKPPSVSATKQSIGLPRNSTGAQAVPTIQRNRDTELNSLRSDVTSLQLTSSQNDITVEQLKEKVDSQEDAHKKHCADERGHDRIVLEGVGRQGIPEVARLLGER